MLDDFRWSAEVVAILFRFGRTTAKAEGEVYTQ